VVTCKRPVSGRRNSSAPLVAPPSLATPTARVTVVPADDREAVGEVWEHLESNGAVRSLFVSWTWTRTWLESFGSVVPHHFVVVGPPDDPVGAAPVTLDRHRRGPFRFRRAHLGTAGEPPGETVFVERNCVVALPDRSPEVADALAGHLRTLPGIHEVALDGFLAPEATRLIGSAAGWSSEPEPAHVVDLALAGDEDVATLFSRGSARSCGARNGSWVCSAWTGRRTGAPPARTWTS
jgi:hypothetical protein